MRARLIQYQSMAHGSSLAEASSQGTGKTIKSMILFGSDLRDGNRHNPQNLPILLTGRGRGRIDVGQHLSHDNDTPLSNLYRSILAALDVPATSFADSTRPLPGVLCST